MALSPRNHSSLEALNGLLLTAKPTGISSYDVIRKLKQILRPVNPHSPMPKIGHAGTLDPMASGLLLILLGKATKRVEELHRLSKIYDAEITLGATSTTDDAEGKIKPSDSAQGRILRVDIETALKSFIGEIKQTPPQFSAVKVKGQRAYQLARKGQAIKLSPKLVRIYDIKIHGYRYPKLKIVVKVSSGTYIRALARDIGVSLGVGAYLSKLVRTSIGPYLLVDAISYDDLSVSVIKSSLRT